MGFSSGRGARNTIESSPPGKVNAYLLTQSILILLGFTLITASSSSTQQHTSLSEELKNSHTQHAQAKATQNLLTMRLARQDLLT